MLGAGVHGAPCASLGQNLDSMFYVLCISTVTIYDPRCSTFLRPFYGMADFVQSSQPLSLQLSCLLLVDNAAVAYCFEASRISVAKELSH
jgi:hypothetical protein